MGETVRTVGAVLAEQVRRYREAAGLRQEDLSERTAELGYPLNRVTLAKIEKGGTRADNASLVDVLVLAAALDVPPVLLFLPLGEVEAVEITPGITVHPHLALEWVAGEETFTRNGRMAAFDPKQWSRNALPVYLFRRLRELQDALGPAGAVSEESSLEDVQRLEEHVSLMDRAGLSVPTIPGVNDDGER